MSVESFVSVSASLLLLPVLTATEGKDKLHFLFQSRQHDKLHMHLCFISLFRSVWTGYLLEHGVCARGEVKPMHQQLLISKNIIWVYSSCRYTSVYVWHYIERVCVRACVCVGMHPSMYKRTYCIHTCMAPVGGTWVSRVACDWLVFRLSRCVARSGEQLW